MLGDKSKQGTWLHLCTAADAVRALPHSYVVRSPRADLRMRMCTVILCELADARGKHRTALTTAEWQ